MEHSKLFPIRVAPIHRITFFFITKEISFFNERVAVYYIRMPTLCVCSYHNRRRAKMYACVIYVFSKYLCLFCDNKKKKTKINMKMFDKISASFLHWNGVIHIYDVFNLWQLDTCVDNLVTNNLKHFSFPWIATIVFLSPLMF